MYLRIFISFFLALLFTTTPSLDSGERSLKVLHITFHKGCQKDFEDIATILKLDLTTIFIKDLAPYEFDPKGAGSALYNIGHDRAERIWNKWKDYFDKFDVIITSDTVPLARIFLQNEFKKPLIIWMCNRFDYCDEASLDCTFPDTEFYDLMRKAIHQKNVQIIAYTEFEHQYASSKGVFTGNTTITPCAPLLSQDQPFIPSHPKAKKAKLFFLPPYHNETIFINLKQALRSYGIRTFCGRYNGPLDIKDFKGVIHLPYAWSNLFLFENLRLGIIHFVPSKSFMRKLITQNGYWHTNVHLLQDYKNFEYSEWYSNTRRDDIIYFESWNDLKTKIKTLNFAEKKASIQKHAQEYSDLMINKWNEVFNAANTYSQNVLDVYDINDPEKEANGSPL
jgi:hypothetical protein